MTEKEPQTEKGQGDLVYRNFACRKYDNYFVLKKEIFKFMQFFCVVDFWDVLKFLSLWPHLVLT